MQGFSRLKKKLVQHNVHYVLLLLYFCLNGFRMFRDLVALDSLLIFFFSVTIIFFFLSLLFNKIISNHSRSGIILLYFMSLFLFFGNIEDSFAGIKLLVVLSEPLYFIPFLVLVSVLVMILVRKVKSFLFFRSYVNTVLLIWVLSEIFLIAAGRKYSDGFRIDGDKLNPSVIKKKFPVYLVVLDEYAGDSTLLSGFNYDNSFFKRKMKQLGFKDVLYSTANYPLTVHSISSTLDMDYLPDRTFANGYAYGYKYGLTRIRNNKVASVFSSLGYRINNFSFFDFKQAPADFSNSIWGGGARVVTARCMHTRLYKHLVSFSHRFHFGFFQNMERDHQYNQIHYSLQQTLSLADRNTIPSFNFIHILSPHKPFLFDRTGNKLNYRLSVKNNTFNEHDAYIWSVQKLNSLMTDWSEKLIKAYNGEVIVFVMSDHGPAVRKGEKRRLDNLNLVYIPGGNHKYWYDGMSNVNQFRILFNTVFGQQLPILEDRLMPEVPGDQLQD